MKRYLVYITAIFALLIGVFAVYKITHADITGSALKLWLTMDSNYISGTTVTDTSGNANTGTSSGSPTASAGVLGQALTFASTSLQYVEVADNANIHMSNALTISLWFRTTSTGSDVGLIRKDTFSGSRFFWGIVMNGACGAAIVAGQIQLQYFGPPGTCQRVNSISTSLNNGKWHHAVGVVNGTTETLYVDGVFQGNSTITITQGSPLGVLDVGAEPPISGFGRAGYFDGTIDDFRLYNTAISTSTAATLYYMGISQHSND